MNLTALLAPVWRGTAYYAVRPAGPAVTTDPSGAVRDMHSDDEARAWARARPIPLSWLPKHATVYDFGCGPGKLKVARPDLTVWGADTDEAAMTVAIKRGVNDASGWVVVKPNWADALWCCHVVEHLVDPFDTVKEAVRMVRPGGTVIVETPDFGSPAALEWGDRFRLLHDPTHISLFTAESLMRMLRALGVEIEEVHWPYFGTQYDTAENAAAVYGGGRGAMSPAMPGSIVAVRGRKL